MQEALQALDRLNSWVRSESFCRAYLGGITPKSLIYDMKRDALLAAQQAGQATHRCIRVETPCRDCGGTGRYCDSYGEQHDHCWKCASTGAVVLQFVETTLPGGLRWHTPYGSEPQCIRQALPGRPAWNAASEAWPAWYDTFAWVTDWQPNTPYDVTLRDLSRYERMEWAHRCQRELDALYPDRWERVNGLLRRWHGHRFVVLAGLDYRKALGHRAFTPPLAGLGIGQQVAWLKQQMTTEALT